MLLSKSPSSVRRGTIDSETERPLRSSVPVNIETDSGIPSPPRTKVIKMDRSVSNKDQLKDEDLAKAEPEEVAKPAKRPSKLKIEPKKMTKEEPKKESKEESKKPKKKSSKDTKQVKPPVSMKKSRSSSESKKPKGKNQDLDLADKHDSKPNKKEIAELEKKLTSLKKENEELKSVKGD